MNFLAHAAVARRHRDDAAFVLGAVLPDLLPMAGVRVDRTAVDPTVAAGWHAHHHADAAFHESSVFRAGVHALRTDLRATALATGPRRAVAHVGWELLLDDTLVGDAATVEVFRAALTIGRGISDDPRWLDLVDRLATIRPHEPPAIVIVAERVHRAVGRRDRLAFDVALVPEVAAVLEPHRARVRVAAPSLLDEVLRRASEHAVED